MVELNLELPEHFLEEELRDGYVVSVEMKKVWAVELDLLNELMRVCNKHNIHYYAAGGTILGAVRHKGYIPWDDDIDIMMMRDEYNRLCEIAPNEFSYPYFFQTEETDPGSLRGHAQLRNSKTTGMLKDEFGKIDSINMGIFIDIFPLDNVPDDETDRKLYFEKMYRMLSKTRIMLNTIYSYKFHFRKNVLMLFIDFLKHHLYRLKYMREHILNKSSVAYNKYQQSAFAYNTHSSQKVVLTPLYIERFVMDKLDLSGVEFVPFEMLKLPIPSGYENILNHTYGDWHTFVKGGSVHGGVFFDTEKPYTEYLKENIDKS